VKLLIVITGLAYGGAETQTKRIALKLLERGWTVRVVSMLPPTAYQQELERAGISVDVLGMRRKIADPRAILRLASIVRRVPPNRSRAYGTRESVSARHTRREPNACSHQYDS